MGALTSLLVLASLLASIEENLPKTSYFKKIDVWEDILRNLSKPDYIKQFGCIKTNYSVFEPDTDFLPKSISWPLPASLPKSPYLTRKQCN